ncbi:Rha family transcriptional regulator [Bacillus thuringiensis]|uniref:Rha family transcriptional regulator n=1 Tax=Bacillus thuringiensis TaxID=1428 RepID=UPI001CC90470|nr:Rha family transcriptional regulator [Bacillus thuringiensis]MBZ8125607.1 Rha family transcriptional regulator [Bacillus thuringiensis]
MSQLQAIQHPVSHLVFLEGNELVTDSLTVAGVFNKRHADVLKSIETLSCSEDFSKRNFSLTEYKDAQQKVRPKYLLKRDGLMFLVMGYTGEKAAQMKESYIYEFNHMEQKIKQSMHPLQMIHTISSEMMKQDERLETIENKLNERMTIDSYQQTTLLNAKLRRVEKLWGEEPKIRQAFEDKRILHSRAWKDFKMAFVVPSYRDTKEKDFEEALTYLKAWRPGLV